MKMIVAVIQPTKLRAVKGALEAIGIPRITICDSQEFAQHTGRIPIYRGVEYRANVMRKITLEIAVNDDYLEKALKVLQEVGRSGAYGSKGDGKIFVLPMAEAIQFHPEKRGKSAI
ncbi:MAG: P-II family nitrogen regulator [Pirellulaceae bacterium]